MKKISILILVVMLCASCRDATKSDLQKNNANEVNVELTDERFEITRIHAACC